MEHRNFLLLNILSPPQSREGNSGTSLALGHPRGPRPSTIGAKRVMSKHFFLYAIVGLIFAGFLFSRTKASGPKQKSEQYAEPVENLDGVYSIGAVRL
jgi:hypothetical protein